MQDLRCIPCQHLNIDTDMPSRYTSIVHIYILLLTYMCVGEGEHDGMITVVDNQINSYIRDNDRIARGW